MDIDENARAKSQQGVGEKTANERYRGPGAGEAEVPLPPDDESPIEEEMDDVDANNSVSSEHPNPSSRSNRSDVSHDAQLNEGTQVADDPHKPDAPDTNTALDHDKENQRSPGIAASDPESGA